MKEPEKTIGRMIEKEGMCFILYVETLETAEAKTRIWREGDTLYYKEEVNDPYY